MADAMLKFDARSSRWDYSVVPFDEWAATLRTSDLLQFAQDAGGRTVGFVFDHEPESPIFAVSVERIEATFGREVATRVRETPSADVELSVLPGGELAERELDEVDIMRPAPRLQGSTSDVVISDDSTAGIVTVSMTVPWWARFTRPWVTIRRRGKRDILLTGPLRIKGRTAKATLRYGMPYSGAALTANVVKGPVNPWRRGVAAGVMSGALFAGALLVTSGSFTGLMPTSASGSTPGASPNVDTPGFAPDIGEEFEPYGCWNPGQTVVVADGSGFDAATQSPKVFAAIGSVFPGYPERKSVVMVESKVLSETRMTFVVPGPADFPSPLASVAGLRMQFVWSPTESYSGGGPTIVHSICND